MMDKDINENEDVFAQMTKIIKVVKPERILDSSNFESDSAFRAYNASWILDQLLLIRQSYYTINEESNQNFAYSPSQVLANPSFENGLSPSPWEHRSRNIKVYPGQEFAKDGVNRLAANDAPRTLENPSLLQTCYIGYDGGYYLDFGLYVRNSSPTPKQRFVNLVIWHYTPDYDVKWQLIASSAPKLVDSDWKLISVQGRSGGRYHRFELYWHDDYSEDINIDAAYCYVQRNPY
ncbi:MAG: hypothetical protein WCJ40_20650 [Planctomycetota bacterium]